MLKKTKVTVIIPVFNEAQTIGTIVAEIRSVFPLFEIIVIDDGSSDESSAVARNAGAKVHRHPYNIGNGAAIKSGIRVASGDLLVFMDGDGQHKPQDISRLLEYFPKYDMVVGARNLTKHASLGRAMGNLVFNRMASYVSKFSVKDLTSGFRAVKSDIAQNYISLLPNTYSYPTTITLSILREGRSIHYIPIKPWKRKKGKSNINIVKDGVRFFMIIVKICTLYSPMRIFLPVSFVMFLTGLFYYFYTFFTWGRFTNMSALLLTTSVIIFMMGLISEQVCQMRFEKSANGHHQQNFSDSSE